MRILLIGPCHDGGSIPPYLDVLATALRERGADVDRVGSTGTPYDAATGRFWPVDRILTAAEALIEDVELADYDVISLHFGNLEIEQLLPSLWAGRRRPPVVHHVHSLDPTLFTRHTPDPGLRTAVTDAMATMDGLVFFGDYARRRSAADRTVPSTVAWLPTTIPPGQRPAASARLTAALNTCAGEPVATLYGYAAPWKDPATLIAACERTSAPARLVIAGPFWADPTQAATDLTAEAADGVQHGPVEIRVLADYLDAAARRALVAASDFAVFPYRPQAPFQGSGAIADYLARGVPVLATDVANMAELVGDAGIVVPPGDSHALAHGLDHLIADRAARGRYRDAAGRRAHRFTADHHARTCLRLYGHVIAGHRVRS